MPKFILVSFLIIVGFLPMDASADKYGDWEVKGHRGGDFCSLTFNSWKYEIQLFRLKHWDRAGWGVSLEISKKLLGSDRDWPNWGDYAREIDVNGRAFFVKGPSWPSDPLIMAENEGENRYVDLNIYTTLSFFRHLKNSNEIVMSYRKINSDERSVRKAVFLETEHRGLDRALAHLESCVGY
jgi:hypothetical protein